MSYFVLKFFHIIGFILVGGGLVGVFVADLRSRQTDDIRIIAEACRYVAIFYDGVVVPGAVIAGVSGFTLALKMEFEFLGVPWFTGMWALFVFEFIEGNTITRIHFRRMLKFTRTALTQDAVTEELRKEQARRLPTFTHFLDLPLVLVMVSFGGLRPQAWSVIVTEIILALIVSFALALAITKRYKLP